METRKKVVATIEARMTSSRLPGKVLMKSCGKTILQHLIERVRRSTKLDDIIVATTINGDDDPIVELCKRMSCMYYRGSEEDVLERVLLAAKSVNADVIVELTGDCPFIDWRHVDKLIDIYLSGKYDYVANNIERSYPMGFDIRIFSTQMIDSLNQKSDNPLDHEHVSIFFPSHPDKYRCCNLFAEASENRADIEVTLDEMGDFKLIDAVFNGLYTVDEDFTCNDVIHFIDNHREIMDYIKDVKRTSLNYGQNRQEEKNVKISN